jgi:hypothetical protein
LRRYLQMVKGYNHFYPLKSKGLAKSAVMMFIHDAGIPQTIVSDEAQEEVHGDFKATCPRFHVKQNKWFFTVLGLI